MNIRKAKITNEIIPPFLSLFKDYNSNLRTRLKANSFFLSFDEKSKKTFNKFVLLSNERFKKMKYGGNLNHILSNQKNNYIKINNDIKNDILYTSNYPSIERNKLIKSVNILKTKEISSLREKLYETLRYTSPYENKVEKFRKKLFNDKAITIKDKDSQISDRKTYKSFSQNDENDIKDKIDLIKSNTKDSIIEDQENFDKGLETYKDFLKNKKNELVNGKEKKKMIKIYKNDFSDIESHINENNIKSLTYKTKSSTNKKKKKKEDTKFEINILYKIKYFNSKNKRKDIFPKLKHTEDEQEELLNNEGIFKERARQSNIYFNFKTFNNLDMKNTIGLVNKEVKNGINLDNKFKKQKMKFNMHYHTLNGINDFEDFEKAKPHTSKKFVENQKSSNEHKVLKNRKVSEHEKIMEEFQKIYEEKKMRWKKEDEDKEKRKIIQKKEKEEIINYLFSLENKKNKKKI